MARGQRGWCLLAGLGASQGASCDEHFLGC
jgi:hypothetical protein